MNTQLNSYTQINENITYRLHIHINHIITVSLIYTENKQNIQ